MQPRIRIAVAGATRRAGRHVVDSTIYASGGLLPGPQAALAGPTFEQWLRGKSS
jgi:hypothetical protein